jgi:CYTH domain-containing protein
MIQTEIEQTYLASSLPDNLAECDHHEVLDVYFPAEAVHPRMRIRKKGDAYMLTKKTQPDVADASVQIEENVVLTREEFEALRAGHGKVVSKVRYNVPVGSHVAEVDVFTGDLAGLVLVDIEFDSVQERDAFEKPAFCGVDVTQEDFIAGGMLAGKKLADIVSDLDRLGYVPVGRERD